MEEILKKLEALIYEPEHAEAPFCWCKPVYIAHGKRQIEVIHNTQKTTIIEFVKKHFYA